MFLTFRVSEHFGAALLRPVEGRSDAEQARRSQVLQDGDEGLELITQPCTSCWAGQGHCESFIDFRLSVQHCPDFQHLKKKQTDETKNGR